MTLTKKISTHTFLVFSILLLLTAALGSAGFLFDSDKSLSKKSSVISVNRKSFSLSVTERGVVSPAQISPISSQISSNQAKIVWLVKEGTHVSKGTLVARFDSKPFVDSMQKSEQAHVDAQATFMISEKLLSLQQEEEAGKIEEADRKLEIAKIKANNIINGSGPLKRKVFEQKLHQAERAFELSKDELEDLSILLEKGHASTRERDKALDKLFTAEEQVQVAQAEVDNFTTYVWTQMQREAELLVNGAESNLMRIQRTAELLIQNRAAEMEKNRRKVENKRKAFNLSKMDVANCDIYAPTDGILLYSELPRENERRKIQIGDSVWVGQTFLELPDTSELIAEIQIREVDVAKIKVGMETEIEVDAFPGRKFTGLVDSIASLAKKDDANANIRRFYGCIKFIGDIADIHVGMSVTTRITHKEVQEVIAVPISSVFFNEGQAWVRKKQADMDQVVPVGLGERGQLWVQIRSGLNIGDLIYAEGQ